MLQSQAPSGPWWKSRVAARRARRPDRKARRLRIPAAFDGGATQRGGMHRPSNAAGLSPRAAGACCCPAPRCELRKGCRYRWVRRRGPALLVTECFAVLELNDDELGSVLEVLCRVDVAVAASQ